MQLHRALTGAGAAFLLSFTVLLPSPTHSFNITTILAAFPEFSTFNHYLTVTHLADDINNRETITVCVVDNAGMSDLLSKHLSLSSLKDVLAFHVLLDYFGAKKLHQITNGTALAATMYQATGSATGSSGFVNITDLSAGKVGFGVEDSPLSATFVKSVKEIPYNISVIQISNILTSPEAEAPAPEPSQMNLTELMSAHGCKVFAETLLANAAAEKSFEDNVNGGLTIFCPEDDAFKGFLPKFKNLTAADQQAVLQYQGVPVYQSMSMLKSSNGVMNTLATDGANNFTFVVQNQGLDVTLETTIVTAKITGTLVDQQPLVIFTIDKVLLPKEIFKAALTPAPAPAPLADAPKSSKHKSPPAPASLANSPSADGPGADQTAADSSNGAVRFSRIGFVATGCVFGFFAVVM